jgi:hypothetical protein
MVMSSFSSSLLLFVFSCYFVLVPPLAWEAGCFFNADGAWLAVVGFLSGVGALLCFCCECCALARVSCVVSGVVWGWLFLTVGVISGFH